MEKFFSSVIGFKDLVTHPPDRGKPKIIVGGGYVGFVANPDRVLVLRDKFHESFANLHVDFENDGNRFFFDEEAHFAQVQHAFNHGQAKRSHRLILEKYYPPPGAFAREPEIVQHKVVFRVRGSIWDLSNSRSRLELDSAKPRFLEVLFAHDSLKGFGDEFNEAVLMPQAAAKAKAEGGMDFFVYLACTSGEAAAKLHQAGKAFSANPWEFVVGGKRFELREVFSVQGRALAEEAARLAALQGWYQIRLRRALAQRNVDRVNAVLADLLGPVSREEKERVTMGHPDIHVRGPCFFVSVRLHRDRAVEALSLLVDQFAEKDLADPVEQCVYGPYELKSFAVCLHCGFDHFHKDCKRVPQPPVSVGAPARPVVAVEKSKQLCKNFLKGQPCPGAWCRFTHPSPAAASPASSGVSLAGPPSGARAGSLPKLGSASAAGAGVSDPSVRVPAGRGRPVSPTVVAPGHQSSPIVCDVDVEMKQSEPSSLRAPVSSSPSSCSKTLSSPAPTSSLSSSAVAVPASSTSRPRSSLSSSSGSVSSASSPSSAPVSVSGSAPGNAARSKKSVPAAGSSATVFSSLSVLPSCCPPVVPASDSSAAPVSGSVAASDVGFFSSEALASFPSNLVLASFPLSLSPAPLVAVSENFSAGQGQAPVELSAAVAASVGLAVGAPAVVLKKPATARKPVREAQVAAAPVSGGAVPDKKKKKRKNSSELVSESEKKVRGEQAYSVPITSLEMLVRDLKAAPTRTSEQLPVLIGSGDVAGGLPSGSALSPASEVAGHVGSADQPIDPTRGDDWAPVDEPEKSAVSSPAPSAGNPRSEFESPGTLCASSNSKDFGDDPAAVTPSSSRQADQMMDGSEEPEGNADGGSSRDGRAPGGSLLQ